MADDNVTLAERLLIEPELVMIRAGMKPDPWQVELLREQGYTAGCVSRQRGKTATLVAKAIVTAIVEAPADVLYTARTLRIVKEFVRRARQLYNSIRRKQRIRWEIKGLDIEEKVMSDDWTKLSQPSTDNVFEFGLANGSRIIGIPPIEETIRGFHQIKRVIIDEASRIPDAFYFGAGAFLSTTRGPMDVYSTPFGKRGFFYEIFEGEQATNPMWRRIRVNVLGCHHSDPMCPDCRAKSIIRITPEWLEQERRRIGDKWFNQEYRTSFEDAIGQLIPQASIDAAVKAGDGLIARPFGA